MQNWLVSLLIAFVFSSAASAEKFTLEVVDLDKASSCSSGYSLKVIGLPAGTHVVEFILKQGVSPCVKDSLELPLSEDAIVQIDRRSYTCSVSAYEWIAKAKPKCGWVPKSLGIARASFQNPKEPVKPPADKWDPLDPYSGC